MLTHKIIILILFNYIILSLSDAVAFKSQSFFGGIGYYSQNFFNEITQKDNASTSLFGETSYPITFRYETSLAPAWFMGTQLSYTLLPRTNTGNTTKVTITHLTLLFGNNFVGPFLSGWDWAIGPGLLKYDISGPGGTKDLNNGTGTATFAIPGNTSTSQKISTNFGISRTFDRSRIGLDLIFESFFSSEKRTQNLMISYSYQFGSSSGMGSKGGRK